MIALPEPTAVQPTTADAARYPGVLPFGDTPLDWLRFFGREEETHALLHQLLSVDLLVLFGRSGVGKTSLLKAAFCRCFANGTFCRCRSASTNPGRR